MGGWMGYWAITVIEMVWLGRGEKGGSNALLWVSYGWVGGWMG